MLAFCAASGFQISLAAELENLDAIQEFIIGNEQLPDQIKKKFCLAVEEIFVNICSYAYENNTAILAVEGWLDLIGNWIFMALHSRYNSV